MGVELARHTCTIEASQPRVWDVLAGNVIQSMPIEQMEFLNETTLVAVLNFRALFVTVPVKLKVEVAEIAPMDSFTTLVTASRFGIGATLRVSYTLAEVADEQTSVTCTVVEESGHPLTALIRWQQRRFAAELFTALKDRLERSCG
jgi:hypothetical protein